MLFLLFFFFLKQFKSWRLPLSFCFQNMTKKGSNCFLQLLEAHVSLILVIALWPPRPIPCLLSEEGRSPCCHQAAVGWGNLKSFSLGQFKGTAHSLDALVRCSPAGLGGRSLGRVLGPSSHFQDFLLRPEGWLSAEPPHSPSNEPLPEGERKTNSPVGFFSLVRWYLL